MNFQVLCCDISIHINIRNNNLLLIKALLQKPAPNWINEIGQKHRKSKFPHRFGWNRRLFVICTLFSLIPAENPSISRIHPLPRISINIINFFDFYKSPNCGSDWFVLSSFYLDIIQCSIATKGIL